MLGWFLVNCSLVYNIFRGNCQVPIMSVYFLGTSGAIFTLIWVYPHSTTLVDSDDSEDEYVSMEANWPLAKLVMLGYNLG